MNKYPKPKNITFFFFQKYANLGIIYFSSKKHAFILVFQYQEDTFFFFVYIVVVFKNKIVLTF